MHRPSRHLRRANPARVVIALTTLSLVIACSTPPQTEQQASITLDSGWHLASAAQVSEVPAAISTAGFPADAWVPTTVPSTVLAALVASGEYEEPYTT